MSSSQDANAPSNDIIEIQETEVVPLESSSFQSSWTSLVPMVLIFAVFYFLLIRPQEKRRRQKEALVSGVQKGEKVITNSGIFGTITKINEQDNSVNLEIAPDVEIKVLKTAILDITSRKDETNEVKKIPSKENKKDKKVSGAKPS